MFWFLNSTVPKAFSTYYGFSYGDLDLLLNWGPIVFIPAAPFITKLMTIKHGLWWNMKIGYILLLFSCVLRYIPSLLT